MRQLIQNLKDGKMELLDVPVPAVKEGYVLVQNHYSVISAGTEGKTVKDARAGYIEKARSRQKEVKQVFESVKTHGLKNTYDKVMNKLTAPSPLGYASSGKVIGVGQKVEGLKVGDFVACGGATASHSEIVSVPVNLCVKVPDDVDLRHAAFTTIGAIALQGIRQADLKLGENCVVVGLGLIGQLTMQLLNAACVFPIGIDINKNQVELANKTGIGKSFLRETDNIEKIIYELTNGYGTDAVIITAAANSNDPVDFAGTICRKKGKVIIVGSVPTGFSRENYYKKELDLKMSASYGPGRYDYDYEEKGLDYPIGYVRWTENRNMQAFVDLLAQKKLNLDPIITHTYKFEEAPKAYDFILNKTEPYTGILLRYDVREEARSKTCLPARQDLEVRRKLLRSAQNDKAQLTKDKELWTITKIGFIGAGNFAQNFLLPNLKNILEENNGELIGVATARSTTSRYAADKFGFKYATCEANEIIKDENINTVFVATRHNLHSEYVIKALEAGKNVFVEKPLAINIVELNLIKDTFENLSSSALSRLPILFVGYNRRFAPHIRNLKSELSGELPLAINYRINAGILPKDHWINDPETGGGRIIGEVCHFIDLCMFLAGSPIKSVSAEGMIKSDGLSDTLIINLGFKNGSIASISYFSNGNKKLEKEYLEVFQGGKVFIINDFKEMRIIGEKEKRMKLRKQDKGHVEEIKRFIDSVILSLSASGGQGDESLSPIPFEELYITSLATFKVIESIKKRAVIKL